jgi:hypothetical protein
MVAPFAIAVPDNALEDLRPDCEPLDAPVDEFREFSRSMRTI